MVGSVSSAEDLPEQNSKGPDVTLAGVSVGVESLRSGPLDGNRTVSITQLKMSERESKVNPTIRHKRRTMHEMKRNQICRLETTAMWDKDLQLQFLLAS